MKLTVTVPARSTPDDPDVLALVEATIAQQASAWTTPVYQGEADDGRFTYLTDAVPR